MDISKILSYKYNIYKWSIGDTYESLDWDSTNNIPKPTMKDLELAYQEMNNHLERVFYKEQRRQEYPPIGDQLDAILKHIEMKEAEGVMLHPDLKIVKDDWRAVKTKYPSPEGV